MRSYCRALLQLELIKQKLNRGNNRNLSSSHFFHFCLLTFFTVIAACRFWFSEISKPGKGNTANTIQKVAHKASLPFGEGDALHCLQTRSALAVCGQGFRREATPPWLLSNLTCAGAGWKGRLDPFLFMQGHKYAQCFRAEQKTEPGLTLVTVNLRAGAREGLSLTLLPPLCMRHP